MFKQQFTFFLCLLGLFLPLSQVTAGTIVSPHKFAWSNTVGYINFENMIVNDTALSGYAWSANKGFIKFNPAQGGVLNDGTGNLSGSAWGEGLGWIDFDGVTINGSTGKFFGTATGALVGTITFDCLHYCDVQTDWRPATTSAATPSPTPSGSSFGTTASGNGGGNGGILLPNTGPASTESIQDPIKSAHAKLIDIQRDGIIDILDFNAMMVNWESAVCGNPADMDKDCTVGIFDFNLLMVYWGTTYQV